MDERETSRDDGSLRADERSRGFENPPREKSGTRKQTDLRQSVDELAERLRKATAEAPLRSLLAAFVLGVWFARRR